jgi:predicted dehydrogenase
MKVVGVAEPREYFRHRLVDQHSIPSGAVFHDWRELAERPRMSDVAIIATQDAMHAGPAIALAEKGYDLLLEKPMAPNEDDCARIVDAVKKAGVKLAVCHVMRYTDYTQRLKQCVDEGLIGKVLSIQHLEPVGYYHYAHSFVRGNWRNEKESSFMLLAKSCHDLDWLRYMMGTPCKSLASFGERSHFRPEEKPEGASDRCLDCPCEPDCPYSALKIYLRPFEEGKRGWPCDVMAPEQTLDTVMEALRSGPYGRCVYACDNDVVDHQVVSMQFQDGRTATFTMTAFTEMGHRKTRLFGSHGELWCDGHEIIHYDFLTDRKEPVNIPAMAESRLSGHGGGDFGLMRSFVEAISKNDPGLILSGPDESLETHRMVFAAERSRLRQTVEVL